MQKFYCVSFNLLLLSQVNKRGRRSTIPLSDDTKAIIASNLVVAQELRRLVSATLNSPMKMDYCEDAINIYQRIMARLSDLRAIKGDVDQNYQNSH